MKKIYHVLSSWATLIMLSGCANSAKEDGLGHNHSHGHNHASENSDEITLNPEDANKFGVYTQMVKPGQFNEIIKVSGQIMPATDDQHVISAPSSGIVTFANGINEGQKVHAGTVIANISSKNISGGDPNEVAKIALDAAKRELDRVTPLHADGIVSTKEYNEIKQTYDKAKAAYSGNKSGSYATALSAGTIVRLHTKQGEYVNAGQVIATVSSNEKLTLRADLPERYYNSLATISSANFRTSYSDSIISLSDVNGKLITPTEIATNAQNGYIPVYFSFDNNGKAISGSFAEIYLIGETRHDVISLPIDAITEQQGKHYVYVKLDDECYEKRLVTLGSSNGKEVEIKSGLTRKDEVVSRGAIIIKLAESSGAIPEGHSHNH